MPDTSQIFSTDPSACKEAGRTVPPGIGVLVASPSISRMAGSDDAVEGESSGASYNFIIGVVLMLIGSIMNNLGNNLMSLGHSEQKVIDDLNMKRTMSRDSLQQQLSEETEGAPSPLRPATEKRLAKMNEDLEQKEKDGTWWLTGTIVFVVGALLAFVSFGFAAQSLLAALESVQFVSNVFFHKYVHGLEITDRIVYSTVCILLGNVLVVAFSSHASHLYDAEAVTNMYQYNSGFHGYLIVSGCGWFLAHGTYAYYEAGRHKGIFYWHHNKVEPFMFVVSATLIGTQSVLHAKCLSMLMVLCIDGQNQFTSAYKYTVWAILVAWFVTAALYIQRINKGLQMYPVTFFIPAMTVCFAFFTIVCGGIFFSEFQKLPKFNLAMFCCGTAMIFAGVSQLEAPSPEVQVVPDENGDVESEGADSAYSSPAQWDSFGPRGSGIGGNRTSSILAIPASSTVIDNRQVIQAEFEEVAREMSRRTSSIVQEGINRARAGSDGMGALWDRSTPRGSGQTTPRGNSATPDALEALEALDTGGEAVHEVEMSGTISPNLGLAVETAPAFDATFDASMPHSPGMSYESGTAAAEAAHVTGSPAE